MQAPTSPHGASGEHRSSRRLQVSMRLAAPHRGIQRGSPPLAVLGCGMPDLARAIANGTMTVAVALSAIAFEYASSPAFGQAAVLTKCVNATSADERIKQCSAAIAAERGTRAAVAY